MQPIHAANLLINKIEKDCQDDITLVVIMGSTLHGITLRVFRDADELAAYLDAT